MTEDKFPVTSNKVPVTENKFPVTRNKFPVTRNIFPLTKSKFLVTGNKFPVTMINYWRQNSANGKWHFISRRGLKKEQSSAKIKKAKI